MMKNAKKTPKYIKICNGFGIGSFILAVIYGIYIMSRHLGLMDSLNFGAGAYYYADIPQFAKYVNGDYYASSVPMWVLIVLFLIWGYLMYRLWIWIDKKC